MQRLLNIEVKDTVFDPNQSPNERNVHVLKRNDDHLYKVWLYLSGRDLPYVKDVTYVLHHTFANPVRKVSRSVSNPDCKLVIWTWGVFEITAKIIDASNNFYEVKHYLSYDKQIQQKGINFIYE